jgi:uncharacterized membrane protein
MMRTAFKLLMVGILFLYPIAIYFGDGYLTPSQFLAGLLVLFAGRILAVAWISAVHRKRNVGIALLMMLAAVAILLMPSVPLVYLRLYPLLLNLFMSAVFFMSLIIGMPIAERMARMMNNDDLPSQAVIYTRRVTWTWAMVLLLNGLVSWYTAVATSFEVWTLYNGIVTYLIFGSVFAGEYMLRIHLKRKWAAAA